MDSPSGITETRERGWGQLLIFLVVGIAVVLVGIFSLLWIALGDVRNAAIVTLISIAFLVLASMFIAGNMFGSRNTHAADRDMVHGLGMALGEALRTNTHTAQVVVGGATQVPQLPAGASWITQGNTLQRADKIAALAISAYRQLYPGIAPSRESIKAVTGSASNETAAAVQSYFLERGYATGGGQGKPVTWIER